MTDRNCTCRLLIKNELTAVSSSCCIAEHHRCTCKQSSISLCLRERESCQKKTNRKKAGTYTDRCICNAHSKNRLLTKRCIALVHENICLCQNKHVQQTECYAQHESHFCVCSNTLRTCKSINQHHCLCKRYGRVNECKANKNLHECTCWRSHVECRKESNHDCICRFYISQSPNPLEIFHLKSHNLDICRAETNLHLRLCICSFGLECMEVCPRTRSHECMCSQSGIPNNNNNRCRQHNTFEIWKVWDTCSNSFLYWLPEEVLMDCIHYFKIS